MTSPRRPSPARRSGHRQRPVQAQTPADPARLAALDVLRAVSERDVYANLLLPSLLRSRGLTGRDAAFATELTYAALRGQGTYDAVLAACSDRALDRIDPVVLDVLRLGTHQLLSTRVGAHAAVSTSVGLAREVAGPGPAGFVNAVLRRVAGHDLAEWVDEVAPDRHTDLAGHLAVRYSHPRWIVTAYQRALGPSAASELEAALAANSERPRVTLCTVPGLAGPEDLADTGAEPGRWSPFAAYLDRGDPGGFPLVREGRAAVQDEASQLAALALTRVDVADPSGRWLDLCAGPGGKARLLAGLAAGAGAKLLAADVRPHRARLVHGATTAVRATAGVIAADGTYPAWQAGTFDRVIADVPCSGLGALRRRPEARWRRSPADVKALAGLQRRLLASALTAARPGGVVAYVTCSPHVAETSAVLADVLGARDDVTVLDAPAVLAEVPALPCPAPGTRYAQFWPHRHGTDAIFLALLRRHM